MLARLAPTDGLISSCATPAAAAAVAAHFSLSVVVGCVTLRRRSSLRCRRCRRRRRRRRRCRFWYTNECESVCV